MPLEQVNIDIEIVFNNVQTKKLLALLCAASKKTIEKIEKLSEYMGLYPDTLETETSAIARFINTVLKTQKPPINKNQGFVVINVGRTSTSIYFILETQALMIYAYNFKTGLDLFKKELQINMNIDANKADSLLTHVGLSKSSSYNLQQILTPSIKSFIVEVEKSINEIAKKHKLQIKNIFLINEAVKIHTLDEFIGKYFSIPTSQFNIYPFLIKNNVVDFFKDKLGYFTAAVGASV
jgi:Tfp pilus assembly PilM family ATPase